jgi:hypothetical protein
MMSEPRPPIHPAPGEWPEVRDLHKEVIERKDAALRVAREYVVGDRADYTAVIAAIDAALQGDGDGVVIADKDIALRKAYDAIETLRKERDEARVPLCIGRSIIGILAREGGWFSENGQGVIAASCLFQQDPYEQRDAAVALLQEAKSGLMPFADWLNPPHMPIGMEHFTRAARIIEQIGEALK